jgi:glycosyltransferase involved in cell wall biosynthesis
MKDNPSVSIVIPLYNKGRYIERALKSIMTQTVQDFEVVVVDDGSTDDGAQRVREFDDPRIRLVQQENQGVSAARNRGIRETQSDLVAFLDADDEWLPIFLEIVLRLRERYPEAGLFSTYRVDRKPDGIEVKPPLPNVPPPPWEGLLPSYFLAATLSQQPVCSSATVIPKHILGEIGGFPSTVRIGEDLITWFKIALRYPIAFTWEVGAVYHMEAENRTSKEADSRLWEEDLLMVVQQALQDGSVPDHMMSDVKEFYAAYLITSAYRCIYQGDLQRARNILASCDTRLFYKERLVGLVMASLPEPLLRYSLYAKNIVKMMIAECVPTRSVVLLGAEKTGRLPANPGSLKIRKLLDDSPVGRARSREYLQPSLASPHPTRSGGIALTFDDSDNINEWYSIRELFLKYNAKVTFFVDRFDMIDDADVEKLYALAKDGHEIGCHGLRHLKAEEFLKTHPIEEYISVEIEPAIEVMEARGFERPKSFAHPYGSDTWDLNVTLSSYFSRIRGIAEYNAPLRKDLYRVDRIFYPFDGDVLVKGAGLDRWYENPLDRVLPALDRAAARGEVLILYAHKPVKVENGDFTISIEKIETILRYSSGKNLNFLRVSDLG